jgi:hypothetical protein
VEGLLDDVTQVTEYDAMEGGGYRLYHVSMAEFLASKRYRENGAQTRNRYYAPTREQHERIARYYLTRFGDDENEWRDCDQYGLRQLVGHMQTNFALAETPADRKRRANTVYAVVFDERFRNAQLEKLGDTHATLSDLRAVLDIALACDDLVRTLECVGVYRMTVRSQAITDAVFKAVEEGDYKRALQQASHYGVSPTPHGYWAQVLQLYLAWEAAEQGDVQVAEKVMLSVEHLPYVWGNELSDALLVRTARTLGGATGNARNAQTWLTQSGVGQNADFLLAEYALAQPLDPAWRQMQLSELNRQLADFSMLVAEGDPEAFSVIPLLDEELVGEHAANLRSLLTELAAEEEGQAAIDQALRLVLPNPYPRYRDIGLVALGVACLHVPDPAWVRPRLQSILETALNQEGVTFAFELPSVLLEEAKKRQLPAHQLSEYLDEALKSDDRWGTAMRARSARAAALFRQERIAEAFEMLQEASRLQSGFAGYGTLTFLSLANRCYEFGDPDLIYEPIWGSDRSASLLDKAEELAEKVRDWEFRQERIKLVNDYREWATADTPDIDTVLTTLSETSDPDTRRAYKDHVSARWASPSRPNVEGLKKLLPSVLGDATMLDTVLGRLFGLALGQFTHGDVAEAIRLCAANSTIDQLGGRRATGLP